MLPAAIGPAAIVMRLAQAGVALAASGCERGTQAICERSPSSGTGMADAVDFVPGELKVVHRLRGRSDPALSQRRDRQRDRPIALQQREQARQLALSLAERSGTIIGPVPLAGHQALATVAVVYVTPRGGLRVPSDERRWRLAATARR